MCSKSVSQKLSRTKQHPECQIFAACLDAWVAKSEQYFTTENTENTESRQAGKLATETQTPQRESPEQGRVSPSIDGFMTVFGVGVRLETTLPTLSGIVPLCAIGLDFSKGSEDDAPEEDISIRCVRRDDGSFQDARAPLSQPL